MSKWRLWHESKSQSSSLCGEKSQNCDKYNMLIIKTGTPKTQQDKSLDHVIRSCLIWKCDRVYACCLLSFWGLRPLAFPRSSVEFRLCVVSAAPFSQTIFWYQGRDMALLKTAHSFYMVPDRLLCTQCLVWNLSFIQFIMSATNYRLHSHFHVHVHLIPTLSFSSS